MRETKSTVGAATVKKGREKARLFPTGPYCCGSGGKNILGEYPARFQKGSGKKRKGWESMSVPGGGAMLAGNRRAENEKAWCRARGKGGDAMERAWISQKHSQM